MRYRSSIETSLNILAVLAKNKEYPQYDMPKAIGKDYRTVLRHLKRLESNNLISLARTEPAEKGGKDKKIYTLGFYGLVELLKRPELRNYIDDLAENWSHLLPLILGKWSFFKTNGCEKIVARRLLIVANREPSIHTSNISTDERMNHEDPLPRFLIGLFGEKEAARQLKEAEKAHKLIADSLEGLIQHRITRSVFLEFELTAFSIEDQLRLLSVCKKDADLRAFVDSEYKRREESLQSERQTWEAFPEA